MEIKIDRSTAAKREYEIKEVKMNHNASRGKSILTRLREQEILRNEEKKLRNKEKDLRVKNL